MSVPSRIDMTASCACGSVELAAIGAPIVSSVCYCRDCRQGSRQIEALPSAGPVRDPDGGTAYILYRRDRIECSKGASLLKSYKIRESSVTNRVVATCCNSAMFIDVYKRQSSHRARGSIVIRSTSKTTPRYRPPFGDPPMRRVSCRRSILPRPH